MTYADQSNLGQVPQYATVAPLDVVGLLRLVWHGKLIILAATTMMIMLGGTYAFQIAQPRFAATATLQNNAQPANLRDVSNHWPLPATDAASLNTQVTILTSDRILTQVISELQLLEDPEFNRHLSPISPFSVTALRSRLRHFFSGTAPSVSKTTEISEKTIENLRGALSVRQPRDTYIFEITAQSGSPEKATLLANAAARAYIASQIATKEDAANADIAWLRARVASLRLQLESQERAVTRQIAQAQIQEETMLDTLSSAVLLIDEERAMTLAALARYDVANASLRQSAEIAQLQDQLSEIDARRTRLREQLATQSEGLVILQQIQREADATRVLYRSFLARLQETQVQRGLDYPDSRLITPATTGHYIGPPKTMLIKVSAVIGALTGLMLVGIQHLGRRGIYHPDHLRQTLDRPVFAALPARVIRKRQSLLMYLKSEKGASASRNMRSGLMLAGYGQLPKMIIITSANEKEGKAALGLALGRSLAVKGPTLLIDAGTLPSPLINATKTRAHDAQVNVDLMRLDNTEPLFAPGYLSSLKAEYTHIVIVAPPVLESAGTQLLTRHADATILAVRWAKTPRALALRALTLCENATDTPVGLVLTKTQPRKMKKLARIIAPHAAWHVSHV